MGRRIKEIENTPVYGSNRVNFKKRDWTEEEKDIIDKYLDKMGRISTDEVYVRTKKVLTIRQSLGKITSKNKLFMLECYLQGVKDVKSGAINIHDIYDLECLYFESEAEISSKSNKASTVSSDSV